jgi:endonuclease III
MHHWRPAPKVVTFLLSRGSKFTNVAPIGWQALPFTHEALALMAKRTRTEVKQEEDITAAQLARPHSSPSSTTRSTRSARAVKKERPSTPEQKPAKKIKVNQVSKQSLPSPSPSSSSRQPAQNEPSPLKKRTKKEPRSEAEDLQARKLKSYSEYANKSPFPTFPHPTPTECHLALSILSSLHGPRQRPAAFIAPSHTAGCGDCPSVLDALVRTILSQNTSDVNSTRAKLSMDKVYGRSDDWPAIAQGGKAKLEDAIRCGGLAVVKSKVILSILEQVHAKYGAYSLDHLHRASTDDAYKEMLSFQGVGPKTASCVLLFCLRRESFAVDTHVWRIAGLLGWRPKDAGREATQAHLDVRVPDQDKYGLHVLMITHGKNCEECKAGGKNGGKCELRKAFGKGKESLKEEEVVMKEEKEEEGRVKDEELD